MRGERNGPLCAVAKPGSSPHARGTRLITRSRSRVERFIPACAGNATWSPGWIPARTVHPRMRGERLQKPCISQHVCGSSPHARGTQCIHSAPGGGLRFIPACAGNATDRPAMHWLLPVHPRMRGERRAERGRTGSLGGSSPHARGTQPHLVHHALIQRFIPACAGNASASLGKGPKAPVHPRMRGERIATFVGVLSGDGSSPHARGTLVVHPVHL